MQFSICQVWLLNKENSGYTRVVVDAENYRTKREKTLETFSNQAC